MRKCQCIENVYLADSMASALNAKAHLRRRADCAVTRNLRHALIFSSKQPI